MSTGGSGVTTTKISSSTARLDEHTDRQASGWVLQQKYESRLEVESNFKDADTVPPNVVVEGILRSCQIPPYHCTESNKRPLSQKAASRDLPKGRDYMFYVERGISITCQSA